ncbi:hypothetical protein BCV69DRAFT_206776 [Microstroma glucosiphilum]|uniref:G-patch domain-containing protein n=1 Tax=Pseudomicrostroma glucosiphilum TaxID=1684307 RepID=A0A316U528_9BASI|nr:hypothetical protein BCV69DRAFT_206776 [Pseudomicrostroma glucosiphilum]PWN20352.1 hypothetical protein BCV69DRAFT_206776 [Pseudomicrostroma glucosiphilum]
MLPLHEGRGHSLSSSSIRWDEDEDVNGFAMSSAGQKARKKRSKRRRQHSPGRPPPINWDADYDPRTPNDYAAWKDVVRNRREALKRMEAQRRREAGDGDDDQEDERDWVDERDREREVDEERLRKYRKWAPPPSYATSAGAKQRTAFNGEEEEEEEKLYISPPPPERPAAPQTAPYVQYGQPPPAFVQPARPAPPSFVTASASTAEAGASIGSPYTSQLPPPSRQSETSSTPQRPMTGEEAYQRRLAMSQQAAHASPPVIARASPADASLSRSPLPPAFQGGGEGEGGDVKSSPAPAMDLAARQSAAAAIAARLASIAPPAQPARPGPPPPPPPPLSFVPGGAGSSSALNNDVVPEGEEEEGDFATRLMSKWGHQSGQGLGAEGNQGMTEALVINKVSNSKTGGWRKSADLLGVDGFGPSSSSSTSSGASSMGPRGRYATADPRARADLEKYGQPSEVILLHGLLSPPAKVGGHSSNPKKGEGEGGDVDEALPGEIAEECAKYGYVERVAIYPHISPPLLSGSASFSPSTALDREASGTGGVVFVVFTGLVGAYKAVRELNGRFFSGRKVRARYFPKQAFAKGEDAWREEVRGWLAGGGAGA